MADRKISQLNSVNTPLIGTEELAITQSGETKKITYSEIVSNNGFVSQTFNNRWSLNSLNTYYRSRNDAWGYSLNPITVSAGADNYNTVTSLGNSNCFMVAPRDSYLDKIFLDFSSIGQDVTQFKICVWAGERVESLTAANSIINNILLYEDVVNKTLLNSRSAYFSITPLSVIIPEGYILNFMISRKDGTVGETNLSTTLILKTI